MELWALSRRRQEFSLPYIYMVRYMDGDDEITIFEWDEVKNLLNQDKHGASFEQARHAFADPNRVILADTDHSVDEERLFCLGIAGGGVMTVRFTYRLMRIRIFGAGYWRKGKGIYDHERRSLH
jgi:uncharacterized DUF497 family protein